MIEFEIKTPDQIPNKGISIAAIAHQCSDLYFGICKNKLTGNTVKSIVYYDFNSNKWCGFSSNCFLKEYYT